MLRQAVRSTDHSSWVKVRYHVLERILAARIDQWPELLDTTMSTCLRPILYHCQGDGVGDFISEQDRNLALPTIIENIRRRRLINHFESRPK